jgi:hypothetical protein
MKSFLSVCLVAGSALVVSNTFTSSFDKSIPDGASFFTCTINGKTFTAWSKDSTLATTFTYADNSHLSPAALFMNAEEKENNGKSYFYIQPLNDGSTAVSLMPNNNLYNNFYVTYKTADNTFYNTTTAPGNLEINAIDTIHRLITGKLNCILYSSTKKDWLLVAGGRFSFRF